jgi:tRNA modification GTPase
MELALTDEAPRNVVGRAAEVETIFALASGSGQAAVAVMRVSGPASGRIVDALCRRRPAPRRAALRSLRDRNGALLDRALVLWFPGPASYTGEDSAEFHLHGGRAIAGAVAEALIEAGTRPAEPGEFTRRAFLNGRMDLLEAEGVADLVEAETEAQRCQALRQMEGALGVLYRGWAAALREMLALQEALIDFSDEEVPEALEQELLGRMARLAGEIGGHLADGHRGERIREGLIFALVGRPNVGKSSLINALAGRDVAIVSPVPGTTRDAIETRVVLGGLPVTLVDTAGLRDSEDLIEAEGIRRARAHAARADLVLEVVDATDLEAVGSGGLVVVNKADLVEVEGAELAVSALTGAGMDQLRARLADFARELVQQSGPPPLTRERHRAHLGETVAELRAAADAQWAELRAEHLRLALRSLGHITGEIGTEEILDAIFGRFCIGK